MSVYMRRSLAKMIVKTLHSKGKTLTSSLKYESLEDILTSCLKYKQVTKKTKIQDPQFYISLSDVEKKFPGLCLKFLTDLQTCSQHHLPITTEKIEESKDKINFTFKPCQLSNVILRKVLAEGDTYGYHGIVPEKSRQIIIVEFSSPNIAKPFHAGHLRSTIIGNFISNLYEAVGHKVIRINYLGDWGTQFGLLAQGYKKYGDAVELKKDPMKHLFMVYVKINEDVAKEIQNTEGDKHGKGDKHDKGDKHGKEDKHDKGEIHRRSMEIFQNMENGNAEELELWEQFRDLSIEKYKEIYERLNIRFTDYEGESMYCKKSLDLIEQLRQRGLLHIDESTGQGYVDIDGQGIDYAKAVIQKSDGTTLYLTRDIAAILDRHTRYKFDKIHYIVENSQKEHFNLFTAVLKTLEVPWIQSCKDRFHIKFGRIGNISTRKGTAVFLEDILNEAKEKMIKTMKSKQTTKEVECTDKVGDILGVSSILIQDFKERRQNTYTFSWDKVLSFKGNSGVVLQYAHARLCSLIELCGCDIESEEFNSKHLHEPEAIQLILHIARYEDTIDKVLSSLEPCHLVNYLFDLRSFISSAHRNLKVKDQPKELAQARLQVFKCAKTTLANGMRLLGMTPLEKM